MAAIENFCRLLLLIALKFRGTCKGVSKDVNLIEKKITYFIFKQSTAVIYL